MYQILRPDGAINEELFMDTGLMAADCVKIYEYMLLMRSFEKRATREAQVDKHMPLYISPKGQEAAEVASAYALMPEDWIFWYTRSQAGPFTHGVSIEAMWRIFYGIADTKSVENNLEHNSMIPYVLVGVHLTHAVGFAWAKFFQHGKPALVSVSYFGDGATSRADFHSAMNFAGVHKVPTIFICENNQWAISTPTRMQTATKTFAEKAVAYGIASERVDGNDPFAVYAAAKRARQRAMGGEGATLIEAVTYRLDRHTTAVGELIKIPEEEKKRRDLEDPLVRMKIFLMSERAKRLGIEWNKEKDDMRAREIELLVIGVAKKTYAALKEINGAGAIEKSVELNEKSFVDEKYRDFSTVSFPPETIADSTPRDAINFAHYDILTHDPRVVVMGEDVGAAGSVNLAVSLPEEFIKKHLPKYESEILVQHLPQQAIFGKNRIIDTPLDEWGIMGHAIGWAMAGFRPIVEIQYSGFVYGCGDHVFVELPRMRQRSGGLVKMPVVVRLPYGGGSYIESHREFEAPAFMNLPGFVIVCPSTVQDFYDMLWAAVASDKPVLFFEDKNLYRGEVKFKYVIDGKEAEIRKNIVRSDLARRPAAKPIEDFGIRIAREGRDVTITAYGRLVYSCLEAADMLEKEGISAEVLDIRVFAPLDKETLISSVAKTGGLVIVQEEPVFAGTGAEIAATVYENQKSFERLSVPLVRVGPPRCYNPPPPDWHHYEPQPDRIANAVKEIVKNKS